MSKTIEIPDIDMWEETDSELAKLNIIQLLSDNEILTRKFKKVMKQITEQDKKINIAIKYIKQYCIDDEFYVNLTKKEKYIIDVLNILEGKDN